MMELCMAAPKKRLGLKQVLKYFVENRQSEFELIVPWCLLFLKYLNINETYDNYRLYKRNSRDSHCSHVLRKLEFEKPKLKWIYENFDEFRELTYIEDLVRCSGNSTLLNDFDTKINSLIGLFYSDIGLYHCVSSSLKENDEVIETLGRTNHANKKLTLHIEAPIFKNKQTLIDLIATQIDYYYECILENQGNRESHHTTTPISEDKINLVLPSDNERALEKLAMAFDVFRLKNHAQNVGAKSVFSAVLTWFEYYLYGYEPLIEVFDDKSQKSIKTLKYFPDMNFCAEWIKSDLPVESGEEKLRNLYRTAEVVVDNILSGSFPILPDTKAQKMYRNETFLN